jgi:hypothetical protein
MPNAEQPEVRQNRAVNESEVPNVVNHMLSAEGNDRALPLPTSKDDTRFASDAQQLSFLMGSKYLDGDDSGLRRKLLGMSSVEIKNADAEMSASDRKESLEHRILTAPVSDLTKATMSILLKGKDKISEEERKTLIDMAVQHRDLNLMGDIFGSMAPNRPEPRSPQGTKPNNKPLHFDTHELYNKASNFEPMYSDK